MIREDKKYNELLLVFRTIAKEAYKPLINVQDIREGIKAISIVGLGLDRNNILRMASSDPKINSFLFHKLEPLMIITHKLMMHLMHLFLVDNNDIERWINSRKEMPDLFSAYNDALKMTDQKSGIKLLHNELLSLVFLSYAIYSCLNKYKCLKNKNYYNV